MERAAPGASEWPLVGRDAEVARLEEVLASRGGGAVVLAGEPGVGKTRLAKEALSLAERGGAVTAWAAATPSTAGIPLGALAPLVPVQGSRPERRVDVLQGAVRALGGLGGGRRVVLGVDDAHLLDDLSATVVAQLAAGDAALVLATIQTGRPAPDPVVALGKSHLGQVIDIGTLGSPETEALLAQVLGGPVDGATLRELWEASRGNVLVLRELVLGGLDAGLLRCDAGTWRLTVGLAAFPGLTELVDARLADLTADQRETLEVVAVAGAIGLEAFRGPIAADAMTTLERKGLLVVDVDGRRVRARLAHPLHGEVLRDTMPSLRKVAVQRRLADAVEGRGARRREDTLRVAVWRLEEGGSVRPELLLDGAKRVLAVHDEGLAERLARAALDAGAGPKGTLLLARILQFQKRGDEALLAMDSLKGAKLTEEQQVELALTRAECLLFANTRQDDVEEVLRSAEEHLGDEDLRDHLMSFRAVLHLFADRPVQAAEAAEAVLSRGRPGPALVRSLLAAVPAWAVAGRADDACARSEPFLDMVTALEEELPFVSGQFHAGREVAFRMAGRLAECSAVAQRGYAVALEQRDRDAQAAMAAARGQAELAVGKAESAARWFREAVALLREMDYAGFLPLSLGGLVQAMALMGDASEADTLIAEAEAPPVRALRMEVELAKVWAAAARGRPGTARHLALGASARAEATGQLAYEALLRHDVARLGDPHGVSGRLEKLSESIQGALVPVYAAHAAALAGGDGAALDEVSTSFEELGALLLAAESAAEAAAAHERAGDSPRSSRSNRRALGLAGACGGARTPALAVAPRSAPLTEREVEVVLLVAGGAASKEIAAHLSVSRRTVENHLQHAYRKLGVANRRELAAMLRAEG